MATAKESYIIWTETNPLVRFLLKFCRAASNDNMYLRMSQNGHTRTSKEGPVVVVGTLVVR